MHIAVGPFGGSQGKHWEDGCFHGVKEIFIKYEECIDSIQMAYIKTGDVVHGERHGGTGGGYQAKITLNHPKEYLIGVTCHFDSFDFDRQQVVKSICFKSNYRSFGPYGKEEGIQLCFPVDGGKIVGFRGKSGKYLNALGLHLAPIHHDKMKKRLEKCLEDLKIA